MTITLRTPPEDRTAPHHITRRRLAHTTAWAIPAAMAVGAAPALAVSQQNCADTGLQPFPPQINMYNKVSGQNPSVNLLPYSANGWTASKVGQTERGAFSFTASQGFRNTMDPVARSTNAELDSYVTATARTIVGCTYTISTEYTFSGILNLRPMVAWIQVDGVDHAQRNSSSSPATGTMTYTFTATSAQTSIALHTRVVGSALSDSGVDINMSAPVITCSCTA